MKATLLSQKRMRYTDFESCDACCREKQDSFTEKVSILLICKPRQIDKHIRLYPINCFRIDQRAQIYPLFQAIA